jgi:hypothetical protein
MELAAKCLNLAHKYQDAPPRWAVSPLVRDFGDGVMGVPTQPNPHPARSQRFHYGLLDGKARRLEGWAGARGFPAMSNVPTEAELEIEFVDADMTPRDIIDVLGRLPFRRLSGSGRHGDRRVAITIDQGVRDYLIAAVTARCGNSK